MRSKILLFALLATFSLQVMATNPLPEDELLGPDLGIELVVYPNPTHGIFFLNIKNENPNPEAFKVKVLNLIGQTVVSKEIDSNRETQIDISVLPKGFYYIRVEVGKQQMVKRLVLR